MVNLREDLLLINHPFPLNPPPHKGSKLSRRTVLIGSGLASAGIATALLKPWELFYQEIPPTTTLELRSLGQELTEWKLLDGRKMSDLFTEVQLTADLLKGNLDPKTILPSIRKPITLSIDPQVNIGGLEIEEKLDRNDSRKIEIYNGNKLLYQDNWLSASSVKLQFAPNIQSSPAHLYVAVKEITQLLYRKQYQDLYRSLLENGATRLVLNNPTNIPTIEAEKTSSFGTAIARFERDRYGYSSLDDFIDAGSRLQVSPIGATFRLDQEKKKQPTSQTYWSQIEQADTKFLRGRGLLQEEDGVVKWARPFVVDEDFFLLFADYVKPITNHRVLILP